MYDYQKAKPRKAASYPEYERQKKIIQQQNLTPAEYSRAIVKLARKLGI